MKILYCVKVFFFFHINLGLPSNSSRAVYREQGQCAEISVCVRNAHFYTGRRLVMQRLHQPGQGWVQGFWNHQHGCHGDFWEGQNVLLQSSVYLCILCAYTCVHVKVKWIMVPRAVVHTLGTRYQRSRDGLGISLLAVTLEGPCPPNISSLACFLPV